MITEFNIPTNKDDLLDSNRSGWIIRTGMIPEALNEKIFESTNELDQENKERYLNITKMLIYLFSWFVCHLNEEICKELGNKLNDKKKKSTKSDMEEEWEDAKEKTLEYVYRLLHLPLHRLWKSSIVEEPLLSCKFTDYIEDY